jgi:hypothetical protein
VIPRYKLKVKKQYKKLIRYKLKKKNNPWNYRHNNPQWKHGMSETRLFRIWRGIKGRVTCKTDKQYPDYGGRGIKMSKEWYYEFLPFYHWAINNGYDDHLVIDRIDNDGHYCPSNCHWVTRKVNNRNSRHNVLYTINNKTKCLVEWTEKYNMPYKTVWNRINDLGWDIQKALTTPIPERYRK